MYPLLLLLDLLGLLHSIKLETSNVTYIGIMVQLLHYFLYLAMILYVEGDVGKENRLLNVSE